VSAWRAALADLANAGGVARGRDVGDDKGRAELARMGLATYRYTSLHVTTWALTDLGRDVAEGRVLVKRNGPRPMRYVATWLKSLPQLRITV
jgi:hypothetical protein